MKPSGTSWARFMPTCTCSACITTPRSPKTHWPNTAWSWMASALATCTLRGSPWKNTSRPPTGGWKSITIGPTDAQTGRRTFMPNVYVVPTKDALRTDRRTEASAIVLDIIFATSSMVAALESGVSRVLPALDLNEAEQLATGYAPGTWILAGEKHAESFPGYHSYEP